MKKSAFIPLFIFCLSIGLSGCSTHSYTMKEPPQLTAVSGLGDSVRVFEKYQGPNSGNNEIGRFQNGLINPLFLDLKAYEVMIDFEQSDEPRKTKQEAMDFVSKMIPLDAVKQKEYTAPDDSSREIIEYKSSALQRAFSEQLHVFGTAEPGVFTVALRKDKKGYYRAVIGTGRY